MRCVPPLLLEGLQTPPAEACPCSEGTHPAHPWSDAPWAEAMSRVLQLQVSVGSSASSSSRLCREPGLGHPLQRAAGLRRRWARSLVVLVSQAVGGSWVQGRDRLLCSSSHSVAARPERSLLHYVPNDFCAELPWYSLSISVSDLRFCRMADSHHQDTVQMACGPLLGGESLSVSPA